MYTKNEFKELFANLGTDELIEKALRPLTEEAMQATRELLQERGVEGHALELKVDEVRRELIGRGGVTNQCDYCGGNTGFLPLRQGQQKFCSEGCREESELAAKSTNLAPDLIYEHAMAIKFGECPKCNEPGRVVEMRTAFHVLSLLWFYRYSETMELCCRSCGKKSNGWAAIGCMTLGWWSFPGLFSTPYTICKNIAAAVRADKNPEPSEALIYRSRLELARLMPEFDGPQWSMQADSE